MALEGQRDGVVWLVVYASTALLGHGSEKGELLLNWVSYTLKLMFYSCCAWDCEC